MLDRIAALSASRHLKWVVIVAWVAFVAAITVIAPTLGSVTSNDDETFLPEDAESTRVSQLIDQYFPSAGTPAIVVFRNPAGLSDADLAEVRRFSDWATSVDAPGNIRGVVSVFTTPEAADSLRSNDGTTMTVIVNVTGEPGNQPYLDTIEALRERTAGAPSGLEINVSGPGGLIADLIGIFNRIDSLLLYVTVGLILVLLIIIYRSPVVAFVPLVAVGLVFAAASAVGAFAADRFGLPVNGQARGIMTVLLFGAGTDYTLFLSSRFREELTNVEDKHEAIRRTVRSVGGAIASSAGTILVATLTLLLAVLKSTQTLGPLLSIAVAIMLIAALTLIPALLAVLGRWAFWPLKPRYEGGSSADREEKAKSGFWAKIATQVVGRPVVFLTASLVVFGLMSTGVLRMDTTYDSISALPEDAESRQGFEALRQAFPAGELAPTEIFLKFPEGTTAYDRLQAIDTLTTELAGLDRVAAVSGPSRPFGVGSGVGPAEVQAAMLALPSDVQQAIASDEQEGQAGSATGAADGDPLAQAAGLFAASHQFVSAEGKVAYLTVTLTENPYGITAIEWIDDLRREADAIANAAGLDQTVVLVGGPTATNYDTKVANNRDFVVLFPIILGAIGIILGLLLRSIIAPLYLVATIVLSNVATLGLLVFVFQDIVGDVGVGASVPFFLFVFLVALGVDYNIYLMSRIREEVAEHDLRAGVRIALARTGGVITSAGIILAGTFLALLTLPLRELEQLGFAVAAGVLLDTFVSRTLIVPSVVVLLGRWNWWPSDAEPDRDEHRTSSRGRRQSARRARSEA